MGRNNQARRQQKKRQKQKQQKTSTGTTSPRLTISVAELADLCDPVKVSLEHGEPPPPSIMKNWASYPVAAAARPLLSLLIGFIDFLFHEETAKGDLASLTPHRRMMQQTDLAWLYSLLHAYCLISDPLLAEGDGDNLHKAIQDIQNTCDIQYEDDPTKVLCAPLYLLLWVLGRPVHGNIYYNLWFQDWLGGTSFKHLVSPLKAFFRLKQPKPKQKTVQTLESALARMECQQQDEWLEAISQLLKVFFRQRLSSRQRQSATWQQCPQLSRLAGLVDSPQAPRWSTLTVADADTATLNHLERFVSTASMPYMERLSLETLKCRILGLYTSDNSALKEDFERQFEQIIYLMSVGVPAEHTAFAEQCLTITCEWLAQQVGAGRIPTPAVARLRPLTRLRSNDYRVALLDFLARGAPKSTAKHSHQTDYQHIHFPLFFQALKGDLDKTGSRNDAILERFFHPLAGEIKKTLFIQSCQKVFLSMDEYEAERFWQHWQQPLFDVTQAPFNAIINGQKCEAELLLYMAIAAVDTGYGIDWLQADQLSALMRSSEQLLNKYASHFNQRRITGLLNALITHPDTDHLFQNWEPVIALIQRIKPLTKLVRFLKLALTKLHQQGDCEEKHKNTLYALCRSLPTLRQYLSSKSASPQRGTPKAKQSTPAQPSPNLDLFGESL